MFKLIKYTLPVTFIMMSLLITACSAGATPETKPEISRIETAVAETVAAQNAAQSQNTPTSAPPVFTQTPLMFSPTLTPLAPFATLTQPANTAKSQCASASLMSETITDGQIFGPGEIFTKTWEIKNTSTCTWDANYRIVFWNGDVLGGAYYYNLPQVVAPGQTLPISLVLTAPKEDGPYTSEWMLQTPDSIEFGVGQYNAAFYAKIEVSASSTPNYTVTAVDFNMVRDPATGCVANENYTLYATLTTNGPVEVKYYWAQSDGNSSNTQKLDITSATTTTISRSWKLHIATTTGTRWISLVIVSPFNKEYPHIEFTKTCGG